jgi:ABC-type Zn2+ transport system substrate-binding protein/surface adhesin
MRGELILIINNNNNNKNNNNNNNNNSNNNHNHNHNDNTEVHLVFEPSPGYELAAGWLRPQVPPVPPYKT